MLKAFVDALLRDRAGVGALLPHGAGAGGRLANHAEGDASDVVLRAPPAPRHGGSVASGFRPHIFFGKLPSMVVKWSFCKSSRIGASST